jgi:hypothetical protein
MWATLKNALTCDDLFIRIVYLFVAILFATLSWIGIAWLASERADTETIWLSVALIAVIACSAYATLMLCGTFAKPNTKPARLADRWMLDAAADDGLILLVVIVFPAVLVTLLLRVLGVSGYAPINAPPTSSNN